METPAKQTADTAYIAATARALEAIKKVDARIHDCPAPEGETKIDWSHVGDMVRIAALLEEILK